MITSNAAGRDAIGKALKARAKWVNARLAQARQLGTPFGEETITETLMLDLQAKLGPHLEVQTFTKYEESRNTGADWEWWFCDGQGQRMYGMRVQAKKLKTTKAGVPFYDFSYKPKKSKKRQVDRLLASALRDGLPAVYALYNGPDLDLSLFNWRCCTEKASVGVFGVSMLSARAAQALADIGDTTLATVGGLSLPWSCYALCENWLQPEALALWPGNNDESLSAFAADLVTALMVQDAEYTGLSARRRELAAASGFRTWNEAPFYVTQMIRRATRGLDPLGDLDAFDVPSDLGGVVTWVARATDGDD